MKILIIDETGVREFTAVDADSQNQINSNSIINLLKESVQSDKEKPIKNEIKLLTISNLVHLFTTTRPTIYSWIDNGDLIPIKVGGRVYFNQDDVQDMIAQKSLESKFK